MHDLDQLYQQLILEHSKFKHGYGALPQASGSSHQVNPTCGDEITLEVEISDGRLAKLGWVGSGCSISQASASVMYDLVAGEDLQTVEKLGEDFLALMRSKGQVDEALLDRLEDGAAFTGVSLYPARIKCALLGWMALKDAVVVAREKEND